MNQTFNPFSARENLASSTDEIGMRVTKAYALCLVQNATSNVHGGEHRVHHVGPYVKLTKESFLKDVGAIAYRSNYKRDQIAQKRGLLAHIVACSCVAIRFGEILQYETGDIGGREALVTYTNPKQGLFFVGQLSSYAEQMDVLEIARNKNERTQAHTNTWKRHLGEHVSNALRNDGVGPLFDDDDNVISNLPVIIDTLNRPHVPLVGDGIIHAATGEVVWWLNHYVDMGRSKERHFFDADQTFVVGHGKDRHALRTIDTPAFAKGKNNWPLAGL